MRLKIKQVHIVVFGLPWKCKLSTFLSRPNHYWSNTDTNTNTNTETPNSFLVHYWSNMEDWDQKAAPASRQSNQFLKAQNVYFDDNSIKPFPQNISARNMDFDDTQCNFQNCCHLVEHINEQYFDFDDNRCHSPGFCQMFTIHVGAKFTVAWG